MSNSSMGHYRQYYDSQNHNSTADPNTQKATNQSYNGYGQYPNNDRSQYAPPSLAWNTSLQQTYGNAPRQDTRQIDSWQNNTTQNSGFDGQRHVTDYAQHPASGSNGPPYQYSMNSNTSTSQNTQGLNNLAYVSVHDTGAQQRNGHGAQQSSVSTVSSTPSMVNEAHRIKSPSFPSQPQPHSRSQSQSVYNSNVGPGTHSSYQESHPTNTQPSSSAAATALAGAVSRCYPQASNQIGQASMSPTGNPSRPATQNTISRTASPHFHASSSITQTQAPPVPCQSVPNSTHVRSLPKPQIEESAPVQNKRRKTSHANTEQVLPVNSISNLVTRNVENEPPAALYSMAGDNANDMPNYIDPTQVFNPYHKEHERRRREAAQAEAEAEARRRADAEVAEKRRLEAEAESRRLAAEAERLHTAGEQATRQRENAATPLSGVRKTAPLPKQQQAVDNPTTNPTTDQVEADMAAEMKAMMEKMKVFRSKDPAMFQKLWDDMRKPGQQGAATSTGPTQSPSPHLNQSTAVQAPQITQSQHAPLSQTKQQSTGLTHQDSVLSPQKPSATATTQQQSAKSNSQTPNRHRVVVENNPEGLPDLGRFPAERRNRYGRSSKQNEASAASVPPAPASNTIVQSTPSQAPSEAYPGEVAASLPQSISSTAATVHQAASSQVSARPKSPLVNRPSGNTVWPEEKRNALADAAVSLLKGLPGNANIELASSEVHAMLEKNPSYIELCILLESKGLRFHRGHFARQLLNSVPYLNAPTPPKASETAQQQQQPQPSPLPSQSLTQPPPAALRTPTPHQPTAITGAVGPHMTPSGNTASTNFPAVTPLQFPTSNSVVMSVKHEKPYNRPSKIQKSIPSRPEPPPGSKEAMARKQDFSELIDLTALGDNDDYVMSSSHSPPRQPSPEPDSLRGYNQQTMSTPSGPARFPAWEAFASNERIIFSQPVSVQQPQHLMGLPKPPQGPRPPTKNLAKPLNHAEGLAKTYYDPKTVARDILIASGRHPTERPLNAHMAGLLNRHISIDSDLSTFDWDAVDPGGPPAPQVEYTEMTMGSPQRSIKPDARFNDNHVTRGGDMHAPRLDNRDRDFASRSPPPAAAFLPIPRNVQSVIHSGPSRNGMTKASERSHVTDRVQAPDLHHRPYSLVAAIGRAVQSLTGQSRPTPAPIPPAQLHTRERSSRRSSSNLVKSPTPASRPPSAPAAEPNEMASVVPVKRRGRPPGSKSKNMSVADMQHAAKQVMTVEVPSVAAANTPVFKCRWKGCRAELHNRVTLRQHIIKVHQDQEDTRREEDEETEYLCWWKKCKHLTQFDDGMVAPSKTFVSPALWLKHIEDDHIYPLTLKYGDGPSSTHIDPQTLLADKTRYLSDEQGRLATPSVSEESQADLEPDTITLLSVDHDETDRQAHRSFMKAHHRQKYTPKSAAEEMLRALEVHKVKTSGIETDGAVLATEARRARFIHNPGIAMVVDEED
ncbi:hypothetical protein, variant [Exophiala mesophila]|uniref:C2H2-type domain-containing protein n=1 Tax=Exophiala mesophila TaxID=212818 RepID=A0A0D1ZGK2_EXOME|nr:hypothetical protein, variant [Exophiala mesophila]KIV93817.1 hypothetical protein, variant [Exophiala mesophila]